MSLRSSITTVKDDSLPIEASNSMDQGHQHGFWWHGIVAITMISSLSLDHRYQHGLLPQTRSWTLTWFPVAAWTTDINVVSRGNMDHRSPLRRRNPVNKPVFISDILLLLRVRVIVWSKQRVWEQDLLELPAAVHCLALGRTSA